MTPKTIPSRQALILVVDDDLTERLLIREVLEQGGFTVEEAGNGVQAVAAFSRVRPDIVLLDVVMPEMDGFAACAALRQLPQGEHTPVLMVTGLDDVASINRAYEVGATDFITKPINWTILNHRVRYMLRASQAFEEAKKASQLKSEFLGAMSHELRTPLNIILGYAEMLNDPVYGALTGKQADFLCRIDRNTRELVTLINETLTMSRLETGRLLINLQAVNLETLLTEVKTEMQDIGEKSTLQLQWRVTPGLPPIVVTDSFKLKIVLKNLVANAIKFTPKGSVTVEVGPLRDGVVIRVTDTGIGIAPEDLALIFEPFHRAAQTERSNYGGVGLGLYIVRQILELIGGTVTAESRVGHGSTFQVWLPQHHPEASVSS